MTLRLLARFAALLAVAFVAAVFWTSPSEAHAGHGAPEAASSRTVSEIERPAAAATADAGENHASVSEPDKDCSGSGASVCCSTLCHAAMAEDLPALRALPVALTAAPELAGPAAHAGPTLHIKRPPRPLAATAG